MPALGSTLNRLWNINNNLLMIISSTIRNDQTYETFIQNIGKKNEFN